MKVVINTCFGGYSLSQKAIDMYVERKGLNLYKHGNSYYYVPYSEYARELERENWLFDNDRSNFKGHASNRLCWNRNKISRNDPIIVDIVQELKKEANGKYAELKIVNIPDDVEYVIIEYDGNEYIAEKHRTWHGNNSDSDSTEDTVK